MLNAAAFPQIAALLAQRQQQQGFAQPSPVQPPAPKYHGSIPEIAKAFENDPRTRLANTALGAGVSTAPVAGGKYAIPDGLARVAQALVGAKLNKNQEKKFAVREQDFLKALRESAAVANTPAADPVANNTQQIASALQTPPAPVAPPLGGTSGNLTPQPVQSFDPGASTAAQRPAAAPVQPPANYAPASAPLNAARGSPPGLDPRSLYFGGIVPIEGGTDPQTGKFRTSPKGAVGPGQVMPGTAPEAAKLAGLPFDDTRYRSDPDYNNALGQAYYAKQLEDFGDPVQAAAAYNAGPGRVRRAIRKANRTGTDWVQHLPEETQAYVQNFSAKVAETVQGGDTGVPASAPPQFEDVPQGVEAPTLSAPGNIVPPEVQSNRIAIAQKMLESGNPDLAVIAQQYLDTGLTEQNEARTARNSQQFTAGRDERGAQLQDFTNANSDFRQQQSTDRANAQARNFGRESTATDQGFQRTENATERDFRSSEAEKDRVFARQQAADDFTNRLKLAGVEADGKTSGKNNPFWTSATGLKIQEAIETENSDLLELQNKVNDFIFLNERTSTGGIRKVTSGFESPFSSDLSTMRGIANEITIDALGGLGVAISDGDRRFVSDAFLSVGNTFEANKQRAAALEASISRKIDYNNARLYWRANFEPHEISRFNQLWKKYAETNSIISRNSNNGQIRVNEDTPDFLTWIDNIPKFDAQGNRIK